LLNSILSLSLSFFLSFSLFPHGTLSLFLYDELLVRTNHRIPRTRCNFAGGETGSVREYIRASNPYPRTKRRSGQIAPTKLERRAAIKGWLGASHETHYLSSVCSWGNKFTGMLLSFPFSLSTWNRMDIFVTAACRRK